MLLLDNLLGCPGGFQHTYPYRHLSISPLTTSSKAIHHYLEGPRQILLPEPCTRKHAPQLITSQGTQAVKKHLPKLASGQDTGVAFFFFFPPPFMTKYCGFPTSGSEKPCSRTFPQAGTFGSSGLPCRLSKRFTDLQGKVPPTESIT